MSRGRSVLALGFALAMLLGAAVALAAPASDGPAPAFDPPGQARVRTDKNCYLPGQAVTITLKNVGGSPLVYDSIPDFEIENETFGTVRMVLSYHRANIIMWPGDTFSWTWDQKWRAWDADGREINKGMYVPRGEYYVNIFVESGFPVPDVVLIARAKFAIGDCLAQINAGPDRALTEGEAFRFEPVIQITGDARVTSITWDLDPAVDGNGDGNLTNDIDLAGTNPTYAFGDDGIYNVTMNLRGFGTVSGMDRVPQDTVFAIDSSSSMAYRDPLDYRKIAVKDYVDWMVPDDRGAVVDFDSVGRLVNGDHLGTDYARIKGNVDTIDSVGDVYLSAGLFVALWELRDHGDADATWLVIFLSGAESGEFRDPFYIPQAIQLAKDLGVRIYTVGLNIVEQDLRRTMVTIAEETGGKYLPAASASNLRKIFDDIADTGNQTQGSYFTVTDTFAVTVRNAAPTVSVDTTVPLNVTLRVAGEKYHDVSMTLEKDGVEVGNATIVRMPGSPDNQSAFLGTFEFDLASTYSARVVWTPLDDPVNGNESGANPVWIILGMENGTELSIHHTFNFQQPDTWVWDVADVEGLFLGNTLALAAVITDPGSDDVTVTWDWGDGTVDTRTVLNDGFGPDPYPSPWGSPVAFSDLGLHTYAAAGSFTVLLTVTDDDGGSTVLTFTVTLGWDAGTG